MKDNQESLKQIALTLAHHFDSLYYVEVESGNYYEYIPNDQLADLGIPSQGENFFSETKNFALSNSANIFSLFVTK